MPEVRVRVRPMLHVVAVGALAGVEGTVLRLRQGMSLAWTTQVAAAAAAAAAD